MNAAKSPLASAEPADCGGACARAALAFAGALPAAVGGAHLAFAGALPVAAGGARASDAAGGAA